MENSFKNKNSASSFGANHVNIYRSNIQNNNTNLDRRGFNYSANSSGYNIITGQSTNIGRSQINTDSTYEDDSKKKNLLSKLNSLSNNLKKNDVGRSDLNSSFKSSTLLSGPPSGISTGSKVSKGRDWDRNVYENYSLFEKEKENKYDRESGGGDSQIISKANSRSNLYSRETDRNKQTNTEQLSLKNYSNSTNSKRPSYLSYYDQNTSEFLSKPLDTASSKTSNLYQLNSNNNSPNENNDSLLRLKMIGLDNLGNTCFMNTSLQCLLHTQPFIRRLFKEKERIVGYSKTRNTPSSKAFFELCNEIIEKKDTMKTSVAPHNFKKTFGQQHRMFSGYSQHDSQEFLRVLLEDISQELNRVTVIPKYKELDTKCSDKIKLNQEFDLLFKGREDSIVIDSFYGQTVNIFTCLDCQYETYSFEKFLDIPLLLETDSYSGFTVFELLDAFFKNDKFKWESPCENSKCKRKSYHQKSSKLSILPEILILSFQRYNGRLRRKNTSKIKFEESLDISKYVDKQCIGSKDCKYNLYAISNHTGSLDFGHYYSYVKINDSWCEFNDSFVSKYSGFSNSSNTVYVLFYQRADL